MKKTLKWASGVILTPILLFFILALLIYLPPVQTWLVNKVTSYASEQTGMSISVERVRLAFPLDLGVYGFRMIQPNDSLPQVRDTVADVERLVVDVRLLPLFKQQVEIDALEFNSLKLNTTNFIHEARIKGNVGRLSLKSHGIDLGAETVKVDEALLNDARLNVELSDTVPPDTTKTETRWKIAVDKLDIARTGVTVHMPGDTLQVEAYMGKTEVRDGNFDLFGGIYRVGRLDWTDGRLLYDNNFMVHTKGLDFNHIALDKLKLGIDSFYYCSPKLDMSLRTCSFAEKSGLVVSRLTGPVSLDSVKVSLPDFVLTTPNSELSANVVMDLSSFDDKNPGKLHLTANGSFGKQDIMLFLGGMPTSFIRQWPNQPLTVKTVLTGNMKRLNFAGLSVKLPTAFNMNASGYARNLDNMNLLGADVKLEAHTGNLGFLSALINAGGADAAFRIPNGIGINGRFRADGKRYMADFVANEGGGRLKAKADFDAASMSYAASLIADKLHIGHFLPKSGMGDLTADVRAKGVGTDIMSTRTKLNAAADVKSFSYGKYNFNGINLYADVNNGKTQVGLNSDNELIKGSAVLDALLRGKDLHSTLSLDLQQADLYGMQVVKSPLSVAFRSRIDVLTDMKTKIGIDGKLSDISVIDSNNVFNPDNLVVGLFTTRDTVHLKADCGDFSLRFNAKGGYKRFLKHVEDFQKEFVSEFNNREIHFTKLVSTLPKADLYLNTGKENPLGRFATRAGYTFSDARIDLTSSPHDGLNGDVQVLELETGGVKLDTIRLKIASDSARCNYFAQVRNNRKNKQYVFNALLDGYMFAQGSGANVKVYDAKDSLGLKLGATAAMEENGVRLHLLSDDPILGYKKFHVNEDNYVFMATDRHISANLHLRSDDDMAVQIYTNDENTEALQDLTIGLNKFDLEKVLAVIPYMPRITGMMNGDFHLIKTQDQLSVSSSISVDDMRYERSRWGNIATEFVYIPKADGTHVVDGILMCNGEEVANIRGAYNSEGEGNLDARLDMTHLPVRLLNGFIPDRIVRFRGYADGSINIKGAPSRPQANGEMTLDSCYMRSSQYGMNMRMSEGPLRIVGSNLLFEDFKMYATNNSPLAINGNVDFSNLSDMRMNLNMSARNCQVVDSKERRRSVAFGKAFVDFDATMSGPFNNLKMLGRVNVLGTTDLSYILRDSPLTTDNQMDELVKFVNFNDTTETVVTHEPLSGFSMDLMMNISQGAHVMCYLNTDKSNYVDLVGGGNLRMRYDAMNDLQLTGKYTLDNGEMKYSLPVIPLKTFTIKDGSYIEFTGDPMNPRLNITATESTKANVSTDGGAGRTVDFECGVVITKTLSDMGLEFTLDAPEDMTLHNELMSMSVEQRGKLAVTMLTTGMYIADGNTGGFSMNNALSSFLQSEINNITGNALRTLDLSFGMDNSQDASGNTRTDYSFKFAKRFWNNRLRIVVGGKVSTGAEVENQNESFFDNVTFEYRLGSSTDKYVKLFYDNNAYDWLEGTTREYGVGFIWRRSLQHFKDIFSFKKKAPDAAFSNDTTKTNKK